MILTINVCYRIYLSTPKTNNEKKPLVHSYYGLFKDGGKIPIESIHGVLNQAYYKKLPNGAVVNLSQMRNKKCRLPIYLGLDEEFCMKQMMHSQVNRSLVPFFGLELGVLREICPKNATNLIVPPHETRVLYDFNEHQNLKANVTWAKLLRSAGSIPPCSMRVQSIDRPQNCNSVFATIANDCNIPTEKIIFSKVDQHGIHTNLKDGNNIFYNLD